MIDLGKSETRLGSSHNVIRMQDQFESSADRVAFNSANERSRILLELAQQPVEIFHARYR
jgi:hypothetical protein